MLQVFKLIVKTYLIVAAFTAVRSIRGKQKHSEIGTFRGTFRTEN